MNKKLILIEYVSDKMSKAIEESPVGYTSGVENKQREGESEIDYLRRHEKESSLMMDECFSLLEILTDLQMELSEVLLENE